LASAGLHAVKIWDWPRQTLVRSLEVPKQSKISCVAFTGDGKHILAGMNDGSIRVWEVLTGVALDPFLGHESYVRAVICLPGSSRVVSCGLDTTIRVWDFRSRKEIRRLKGHTDWVLDIASCANGRSIASVGLDRKVYLWNLALGTSDGGRPTMDDPVSVDLARDGCSVGYATRSALVVFPVGKGQGSRWVSKSKSFVRSIAFSPDGRLILSGSGDGEVAGAKVTWRDCSVRLWNAETGEELACMTAHKTPVKDVGFSPNGNHAASCGDTVVVWRVTDAGKEDRDHRVR